MTPHVGATSCSCHRNQPREPSNQEQAIRISHRNTKVRSSGSGGVIVVGSSGVVGGGGGVVGGGGGGGVGCVWGGRG